MTVEPPLGFVLRSAICGHGWYDLAPFRFDDAACSLEYTFSVGTGDICSVVVSERKSVLNIDCDDPTADPKLVRGTIRQILRMDESLDGFYEIADQIPEMVWIRRLGAGRLLRSATVFEDIVKTICTTNCTWSLTRSMVMNLVTKLGKTSPSGKRSFPDPAAMADVDLDFYRNEIKAGYRSEYLLQLARDVVERRIEIESFDDPTISTAELKKKFLAIKGVGNYAAEHMLKLLGRSDHLALDSWIRAEYAKLHGLDQAVDDATIAEKYEHFGRWKGLALWCDVTKSWFDHS